MIGRIAAALSAAVIIAHLAGWAPVRSLVWFVNMGLIISLFVVSA